GESLILLCLPMGHPQCSSELDPMAVTNPLPFRGLPLWRRTAGGRRAGTRPNAASDAQVAVLYRRRGCELRRAAGPHHLAALDEIMAVGDAGQRPHVFFDHQERLAGGLELRGGLAEFCAGGGGQPPGCVGRGQEGGGWRRTGGG